MGASDWTSAFEAEPANTDAVSLGAQEIREGKVAVREVLAVDHHLDPTGGSPAATDNGKHKVIQVLSEGASGDSSPTVPSDASMGQIYTKVSAASGATNPELYYQSAAQGIGTGIVRLTRNGSAESIEAGSKMVFYQPEAPAGWTLIETVNDKVLMVTNRDDDEGTPATSLTGGSAYPSTSVPGGSPLVYNWTMTGIDGHRLTEAEMPAHVHTYFKSVYSTGNTPGDIPNNVTKSQSEQDTGATGAGGAADGTPGDAHTHPNVNWRPEVAAVIICEKNAYSDE